MDTLTFASPVLLRHLTFSEARKMPISEIHLDKVLEGLQFTMDQVHSDTIHMSSLLICVFSWDVITATPSRELDLKRLLN
jgi:flap endonuclease-1